MCGRSSVSGHGARTRGSPKVQAGLQLNQAQANDPGTVFMDLARLETVEACP